MNMLVRIALTSLFCKAAFCVEINPRLSHSEEVLQRLQSLIAQSIQSGREEYHIAADIETIATLDLPSEKVLQILLSYLNSPKSECRIGAINGLGARGTQSAEIFERVLNVVMRDELAQTADALVSMAPPGDQRLMAIFDQALQTEGIDSVLQAMRRLGPIDLPPAGVLRVLHEARRPQSRNEAFLTLGTISPLPLVPERLALETPEVELARMLVPLLADPAAASAQRLSLTVLIGSPSTATATAALMLVARLGPLDAAALRVLLGSPHLNSSEFYRWGEPWRQLVPLVVKDDQEEALVLRDALESPVRPVRELAARLVPTFRAHAWRVSPTLNKLLVDMNGTTTYDEAGHYLAAAKHLGKFSASASSALVAHAQIGSPFLQGRDKMHVGALRACLVATLAETGPRADAVPLLVDELAHANDWSMLAAAARAAGRVEDSPHDFSSQLCALLTREDDDAFESIPLHGLGLMHVELDQYTSIAHESVISLVKRWSEREEVRQALEVFAMNLSIRQGEGLDIPWAASTQRIIADLIDRQP